jgi:hypothetical protein
MDICPPVRQLMQEHIKPSISYKAQTKTENKQNVFALNNEINPLVNKHQHRFRMTNKNSFIHQIKQIHKNTPFENLKYSNGILIDGTELDNEMKHNNDDHDGENEQEKVNSVTMTFQDSNNINYQISMTFRLIRE